MLVVGARGFAKEIIEIICQCNVGESVVFFDDVNREAPLFLFDKYPVLKTTEDARRYFLYNDRRFVLGLGSPILRYMVTNKFRQLGGQLSSVVSPNAIIGRFDNKIGDGVNIMNNVIIETANTIGAGCLLHNASFVSHDVSIGDFCELSPAVNLLGNSEVGSFCTIGTGAIILPGIKIGNNVVIGAGAVVTKNIPDNSLAVGIPAKVIKSLQPLSL